MKRANASIKITYKPATDTKSSRYFAQVSIGARKELKTAYYVPFSYNYGSNMAQFEAIVTAALPLVRELQRKWSDECGVTVNVTTTEPVLFSDDDGSCLAVLHVGC